MHLVGFDYKNAVVVGIGYRALQHVGLFRFMFHTVLFATQIWRWRIRKKIGYSNPEWESVNICDLCLFRKWLLSLGTVGLEQPVWTNALERKEMWYTHSTINSIVFDSAQLIWELHLLYVTFITQIKLIYMYTDYVHVINFQQVAD